MKKVDLRGKKCPITFVYTKLELEEMSPGEILEVILDYPPAFKNVPRSVKIQRLGTILSENEEDGVKTIQIEKI